MNEKLKALLASLQEKADAIDAIVTKDSPSEEEIGRARVLRDGMSALRGQAEQIGQLAEYQREAAGVKQYLAAPVGGPLAPGGGTFGNGVSVLGFKPEGETRIDGTGPRVIRLESLGDHLMDEKKLGAIRAPEFKGAFHRFVREGFGSLSHGEQKVLQEGSDGSGGILAPEEWQARIIEKRPTPTRVNPLVTHYNTTRDSLAVPKVVYATDDLYTTGIRATWTGEVPSSSTVHRATEPVYGAFRVPIYTAMLSIPVTNDFIEDAAVDILGYLQRKFQETVDLLRDNMILNGTGVGQPSGILRNPGGTNQPATVASGDANTLTGDGIFSLVDELPEQYDEGARFVLGRRGAGKTIRQLKDGDGRYLWDTGTGNIATAKPVSIAGEPYTVSGFMPLVAAGLYPLIYGDLGGYVEVDRIGFSIQILREILAETNQQLILGRVRIGGGVAEEWRLKVQVVAAS